MPYIGQPPVSGDTTKSFRLLDNLASFTLSFDATSSSVVDTTANTLTFANHRFVTAQRVTYADGGGTAIGGLTDGTAYFIIKVDQNTIQLASSASNANNGTAISLSSGAVGSHTLNLAFDGTNTKFKATYGNGTKAKISRAGQLLISINGVLQQAQESSTPTLGFGLDSDSTIVFSQAPVSTDVLFGQILADTITNFDTQDNTLDVFTGDGSTTTFNLSKKPASNNDILVTLDGVVQYPTTTSTSNAYSVTESTLTFTAAPADGVAIQVRHIGFAGATSSAVTGLYGRTGNVTLSSSDDDITVGNVTAGIITATSYGSISGTTASFSGNVSVGGTLTYEDVTNIDSVGLITARSGVKFGASGTTVFGDSNGIGIGTTNPSYLVDAHTSSGNAQLRLKSGGDLAQIFLESTDTSGYSQINFADADSSNIGMLQYFHSDNHMEFTVNGSEAARIDSSGRMGLGTASPDSYDGNSNNFVIANTSGNAGMSFVTSSTGDGTISWADGTSGNERYRGSIGYNHTNDKFTISTAASSAVTIDSSARMGLGVTSPDGTLTISATASNTPKIRLQSSSTDNDAALSSYADATGTYIALGSNYYLNSSGNGAVFDTNDRSAAILMDGRGSGSLQFLTANTGVAAEGMRLDSAGRLLIGTTTEGVSGGDQLTIAASAHAGMSIRAGTSSRSSIYMSDGTSGADEYRGYIEYDHASNYMRFGTNAGEQMRLDSSGRLLINDTSATTDAFLQINGNVSGQEAFFELNRTDDPASGQNIGIIEFTQVSTRNAARLITRRDGGSWGAASLPTRFEFHVCDNGSNSATERVRITRSGQLNVFTSGTSGIQARNSTAAGTTHAPFIGRHSATTTLNGTVSFKVFTNGNVQNTNNSYGSLSDIKLKENIVDAASQWEDIKGIRIRKYNFKEETGHETFTQLGVVAQEVETVSPGLVYETPDTDNDGNALETVTKNVNYSVLYIKAVKALQEAQTRIETLETQQSDLLTRVAALEG